MTAILRVFNYEFKKQRRRMGYLLMSLGVPILALSIFFGAQLIRQYNATRPATQQPTAPIQPSSSPFDNKPAMAGVVNQSNLSLPQAPYGNLIFFGSVEAAQAALKSGQIGFYYVIPENYQDSGEIEMNVERIGMLNTLNHTYLKKVLVDSLLTGTTKPVDTSVIARLQNDITFTVHDVNSVGQSKNATTGDTSFALVYIFALILLFSAFTTSGYLMQSVVEEKESRMIEVVLSSVRPSELLAGKILALGACGLIQMVLWTATAIYILRQLASGLLGGVALPGLNVSGEQVVLLLIYFVLGYMLFAALYAAIGAVSNSMREGPQLAAFVSLPAVAPMWATAIFASAPSGGIAVGMSIFPLTAPLAMIMRVSVTEVPIEQIVISIVLLVLAVGASMWLAGRLFRVNSLLSGHMPKLRDVLRLVRETP